MKCYARWTEDKDENNFYRDQTILQFGDSWDLIANIVLLNPGSASPKNDTQMNDYLSDKKLPYFIEANEDQNYYEFGLDRLMQDTLKCFSGKYDSGVIKIYNLFNLKNQNSNDAIEEYNQYKNSPFMSTDTAEIKYENKPVIIATGDGGLRDGLIDELKKYIQLASEEELYSIQKIEKGKYAVLKDKVNDEGLIFSYHPSYTFKYGNKTICEV